jgi:hypothetical protein
MTTDVVTVFDFVAVFDELKRELSALDGIQRQLLTDIQSTRNRTPLAYVDFCRRHDEVEAIRRNLDERFKGLRLAMAHSPGAA